MASIMLLIMVVVPCLLPLLQLLLSTVQWW